MEIRNDSFLVPEFVAMLRRHRVALVVADTAGAWPDREDLTADFVYVRLHWAEVIYASGYDGPSLDRWANRLRAWSQGAQPADAKLISADAPPPATRRDIF